MELNVLRIFVDELEPAIGFYRDQLGLELSESAPEFGWARFSAGAVDLGLERLDATDPEAEGLVGRFVGASLGVTDIHAEYAALSEKGVDFLEPPELQPWGGTLAHFRDPAGNILTLMQGPPAGD